MKGDFTRQTFDPKKRYNRVLMQQGRVQTDADWNEQQAITQDRIEVEARDVIGPTGTPIQTDGKSTAFEITVIAPDGKALQIGAGNYYVDGILCTNKGEGDPPLPFLSQPDYSGAKLPAPPVTPEYYIAYLDVWDRYVSFLEDGQIREVALGGPDTAGRAKTIWQVKLLELGVDPTMNCLSVRAKLNTATAAGTGKLTARAVPSTESTDPCIIPPGAGYHRLENQLYRVEIHKSGGVGEATFKWSRDNGSVAYEIAEFPAGQPYQLRLSTLGRDPVLRIEIGDWLEVSGDQTDLNTEAEAGTLAQVADVRESERIVVLKYDVSKHKDESHPKVRRWDSAGATEISNDGFVALESGLEVKFTGGTYRRGDYWLIPARTITGNIEWPLDGGDPASLSPEGVQHHYCPLALLKLDGTTWTSIADCRNLFPPVTELTSLFYISGDGQEVMPDYANPSNPDNLRLEFPLVVGVANGKWPVQDAHVQFAVKTGGGELPGSCSTMVVTTGADGTASCNWKLGPDEPHQQVSATLLDCAGSAVHLPVIFTANLSVADQVAYEPGNCDLLNDLQPSTVQTAINGLCVELFRFFYVGGDGQEAMPGDSLPLPQPLQVGVAHGTVPVDSRTVRFEILNGGGSLEGDVDHDGIVEVATVDGIASCRWTLGPYDVNAKPRVEATLVKVGNETDQVPIYFNANFSVANQVSYDPTGCSLLTGKGTVQEAIDGLCAELFRFFYVSGDGQEAIPGGELDQQLQVGVAHGTAPVKDATVIFTVEKGGGSLNPASGWTTDEDGIACCTWTLGPATIPAQVQLVKAMLQDHGVQVPIYFNASFKETGGVAPDYLDELRADGVARKKSSDPLGFNVTPVEAKNEQPAGVHWESGVAYVAGRRFDVADGTIYMNPGVRKHLDPSATNQILLVDSEGDVQLIYKGEPPPKYASIATISTYDSKITEIVDTRFDLTHLDEKVQATSEAVATKRSDRRQFVPLLAQTLPNLRYRDGRNHFFNVASPKELAFDGQRIWAASQAEGKSVWIDSNATGPEPTGTVETLLPTECVAFDGNRHLWFTSSGANRLSRVLLDSRGPQVETLELRAPSAIVFDGDFMWVASQAARSITVIDAETLQSVRTIGPEDLGIIPGRLVFDGEFVWVTGQSGQSGPYCVVRFKKPMGPREMVVAPNVPRIAAIEFDGSHIWLLWVKPGSQTLTILKIDAFEVSSKSDLPAPSGISLVGGPLVFDGSHMWSPADSQTQRGMLQRLDADTGFGSGSVVLGYVPQSGIFDGTHLWLSDPAGHVNKLLVG